LRPKLKFILPLIFLLVIATGSYFLWAGDQKQESNARQFEDLDRLNEVMVKIMNYYVEEKEFGDLIDSAINGMLRDLDMHSVYMDKKQYENLMIDTEGEFGGLGIQLSVRDNYPTVLAPIDDTPASRLGIQSGDMIIEIEGESTKGWSSDQAVEKLRGKPGTQVNLKIGRQGLDEPIPIVITREIIKVPSITYSTTIENVGYVRLARFAKKTVTELSDVLRGFEAQRVKGVIIDLRGNPGGLLTSAFEVADLFLDKDKLIVYTEGRTPANNQKFFSSARAIHGNYPVVILQDGASASASEIVAGALQDWDRALIVGQTSFGKGSVQTVFRVGKEDALKLTTQKYFTPSKRCIHRDYDDSGEPIVTEDSTKEYFTESGRVVYGGGGITPDWNVELPEFTDFQRNLEIRGLFFSFAVKYTAYHTVGDNFDVDAAVTKEFKKFLTEKEFAYTEADFTPENVTYVDRAIRREVFRKLHGTKGAYVATLAEDEQIVKILEMFRSVKTLDEAFKYAARQTELAKTEKK